MSDGKSNQNNNDVDDADKNEQERRLLENLPSPPSPAHRISGGAASLHPLEAVRHELHVRAVLPLAADALVQECRQQPIGGVSHHDEPVFVQE